MILITGATGHFGKLTIQSLLAKGVEPKEITALARNFEKTAGLQKSGVNIAIGDYDDHGSLLSALNGVEKLLLISAVDLSKRYAQHENVINAAMEAGVKHIFYTSGARLNEDPNSYLHSFMEAHFKTEQLIYKSGISYTIFKNGLYMDIIPAFIGDVIKTKTIYLPAGAGKVGVALRSEMAEAVANVLSSEGHEGKSYDLVNTEAYSYDDVSKELSVITNETIQYISPTRQEFVHTLADAGIVIPEEYVNILLGQSNGETSMTGPDLQQLLGRVPTKLKAFLQEQYGR